MKQSHKTNALLAAVLVLIMLLLFANQGMLRQNPQVAMDTVNSVISPSATILPVTPSLHDLRITATYIALLPKFPTIANPPTTQIPPASPTATSTPDPHVCTFPLAQTTRKEATSQKYTFSEPQVVLTGDYPDIVGWLPDNQNVIIMPRAAHRFDGIDGSLQTIELFNPDTKETHIYATHRNFGEEPLAWNSALNAIIYPAPNVLGVDKTTNRLIVTRQIRISDGNPDTTQLLLNNLQDYYPMTFKPDGSQIVYWENNGKQNYKLYRHKVSHELLEPEQLIPFDPALFGNEGYSITYDMSWRPNASQLFLYNGGSPTSQTLLLDANTGRTCTLDFGGWVYFARWSPNGRYLAVITQKGPMLSSWSDLDLSVLDGLTGKLYRIDSTKVGPVEMKNCCRHMIGDFSWAPNNRYLIVTGTAGLTGTTSYVPIDKLYLVDFLSGDVSDLFPSYEFYTDWWGRSLAWSPDGSKIIAKCPTETEGRLCLVSVQTGRK